MEVPLGNVVEVPELGYEVDVLGVPIPPGNYIRTKVDDPYAEPGTYNYEGPSVNGQPNNHWVKESDPLAPAKPI